MKEDLALFVDNGDFSSDSIAALLERKAQSVKLEFFEIGYLLNLLHKQIWCVNYSFQNFPTFYDWTEQRLGFKRTTVKNLMLLNRTYCDTSRDASTMYVGACYIPVEFSPHIDEKWAAYSQTALVEMLPLSDFDRSRVTPDLSISAIRDMKKSLAERGQSTDHEEIATGDGQLTDQVAEDEIVVDNTPVPEVVKAEEVLLLRAKRLVLKNVKERQEWLEAYKDNCYLWLDIPALDAAIYRYDFCNGVYLLITVLLEDNLVFYQLIGKGVMRRWSYGAYTFNQVVDYLTAHRDEV